MAKTNLKKAMADIKRNGQERLTLETPEIPGIKEQEASDFNKKSMDSLATFKHAVKEAFPEGAAPVEETGATVTEPLPSKPAKAPEEPGSRIVARLVKGTVQEALVAGLKKQGADYALTDFKYQGTVMQVMAIINKRVSEFIIMRKESDYENERRKVYRMGPTIKRNKLGAIKSGKALPAHLWFVLPKGSQMISKVPEYAGILTFDDRSRLKLHRKAPRLHKDYIKDATYKSIAAHLQALNEAQNAK